MELQIPHIAPNPVQRYAEGLTGKVEEEYDSSLDEEDSFSFTLSLEEVGKV